MKTLLSVGLLSGLSLFLAGCGGGGSSSPMPSASTGSSPVVPASIEYFDRSSGNLTGKVVYDYSTSGQLRSRYLSPGEDGLWDTTDDTDSLFLECDYVAHEEADSALPRQRFLPVHAIARSPSGAAALAESGQPDGEAMYCPAFEGYRVTREEYCTGASCPHGNGGYLMMLSRVREGSVVTDSQTLTAYQEGVEDGLLGQSQQTTIPLDEAGRPETIEIEVLETDFVSAGLADVCDTGSNAALEALDYRSCKLLDETVRYTYADNSVGREVDYYHDYVFNHTEHSVRTLDPELNTYTVEIDKDFVSGEPAPMRVVYQLDARDQVTGSTTREAGEDGLLDTADDVLTLGPSYEYRPDGSPKSTWQALGDQGVHYQYDAAGRLKTQTVYPDTSGVASIKYEFSYAGGRLKEEDVFRPRSAEDPTLVLARRITYRAAAAGFPAGFNADGPQYFSNTTLSGLQRRFDLP
ncbi:hypothetical protein [Alcanivorax sp. DP30]|uniref:hypothetical protein n=1 Tax=Alcanivorax sp. DP30 TaxID=2606217 RepID=UPI00136A89C1|nr:hypothetical protein [Alcanivorax sp. DP30]MZR63258.1 hypothetical protein [Alcanivorax sp. DP30]